MSELELRELELRFRKEKLESLFFVYDNLEYELKQFGKSIEIAGQEFRKSIESALDDIVVEIKKLGEEK